MASGDILMSNFSIKVYAGIGRAWNRFYRFLGKFFGASKVKLNLPKFDIVSAVIFLYQNRLYDRIRSLDGDIVECGVGRGRTLLFWTMLSYDEGRQRHVWGFDSFEGFPEPAAQDASPRDAQKGEWDVTSIQSVVDLLVSARLAYPWVCATTTLVQGFFEDSLSKYTGKQIALLHIDADLYQSYKTVLETFYDKVQPGGVIAIDEYMDTFDHMNFPGAKKAVDEFLANRHIQADIVRDVASGKYYFIKP